MFGVAYGEKYRFESPTARNPTKSNNKIYSCYVLIILSNHLYFCSILFRFCSIWLPLKRRPLVLPEGHKHH